MIPRPIRAELPPLDPRRQMIALVEGYGGGTASNADASNGQHGDDAGAGVDHGFAEQHADYQADLAMALGRKLGKKPRDVAAEIAAKLPADDVIASVEVSGPGFLNIVLRAEYLAGEVTAMR